MSDDKDSQSQSQGSGSNSNKPEEIKPPDYTTLRESYDPTKEKGRKKIKD